ncbi:hypothetical protein RFI_27855 [Reticulomyxa filosa]|uniref:Protein kinase domain-containing protein n=1 Tax=Reticulomyxa filosa TaxID=46433 RepID=X6M7U3_RETFI|nr:hypothetical protein RFI_27855 [Reticulomyxa filosa]|eukprot:ETO09522.1 hypothetical protein RFI_27855 [Reticulomyxa filosa]
MSSPQQSNLRYLKDISFFIRSTYSHTISLQKSLLGEVTVGTLKVGKSVSGFESYENTKSSNKKANQGTKGINIERDQSNGVSNDVDEMLLPSNNSINQSIPSVAVPHEKHVIKIWDKMMLHQLKDRVCENPLIEIEVMQRFCSGNNRHPYFVKFINAFEDYLSYCTLLEYVPAGLFPSKKKKIFPLPSFLFF